jgi:hypothetical protein
MMPSFLAELAHAQPVEPVAVGQLDGCPQHAPRVRDALVDLQPVSVVT